MKEEWRPDQKKSTDVMTAQNTEKAKDLCWCIPSQRGQRLNGLSGPGHRSYESMPIILVGKAKKHEVGKDKGLAYAQKMGCFLNALSKFKTEGTIFWRQSTRKKSEAPASFSPTLNSAHRSILGCS
ncbi:hypothetical protein PtA15_7A343 [Puccinia triticina]|uniref:Uncharacterized protein n=1 Tax=Puccinia triticina TaxID=208348 RepID=A0ABY7CQ80_9BASI|nr:uncharacterized protein PtA15_7A343 [Puccinia triticina]WAQ86617.1 hypothetical protein PtA15_7A343 [Puccinia triticina]WAR56479.1 hypothetical protein PtB15_7B328 [Puccinia triticina]